MKPGVAYGLFSDINSDKFTDHEKAMAIYIVMTDKRARNVKKDAAFDVIRWLWNRCFRKVKK